MKPSVVFYSRTGVTRAVAQAVAAELHCRAEELWDKKERSGLRGYFEAAWDAMRKALTEIRPLQHGLVTTDVVVVGTPVWAGAMTPAVRTFLTTFKPQLKHVAFFCTQGGMGGEKALREMAAVAGQEPLATLVLSERVVKKGDFSAQVAEFVSRLTHAAR